MNLRDSVLAAMRADAIPDGSSGLWTVNKVDVDERWRQMMIRLAAVRRIEAAPPVGRYTFLWRLTEKSFNSASKKFPGECVMNDFPSELRKHLQFVLRARGRVLVTGLGLGCVVRGLLAAGMVDHIDVVERSADVLKLCAASVSDPRVTIHEMDARNELPTGKFDYAWHDLFSSDGEPHLQVVHLELISRLRGRVKRQGAWAMRRIDARLLREAGIVL
jgi:hypothetical protein